MKVGLNIAAGLFRGTIHERVGKAFSLGAWFALCTYVAYAVLPVLDTVIPGDMPADIAPIVGGVVAVTVVALKGL
jgi:hypothetical protein